MKQGFGIAIVALLIVAFTLPAFSQGRLGQFELYAGANLPMGPDEFKDFYKIGLSINGQYVFFPSTNLGIPLFAGYEFFTVDNDAISSEFRSFLVGIPLFDEFGNYLGDITDASLDTEGSASVIRLGAGVRPYLTPPEANTQFFLFGNATFNILKQKSTINSATTQVTDVFGNVFDFTFTGAELGLGEEEASSEKFGVGIGAGLEIPAGESLNLILQGIFNIVFTSEDIQIVDPFTGQTTTESSGNTTFIGVTAGLVF